MISFRRTIETVEKLIEEGSVASLTYAALECRLAIECLCYERLRVAHDYISHDDIRKWQPRDIVNILMEEVDSKVATTFTLSIAKEALPEGGLEPTVEEYEAMEFLPIGTQIGFNANFLGKLWNGLANVALHVTIPKTKDDPILTYGDPTKIRTKVLEALQEIKRIDEGTLVMASGLGEEVSFVCYCGINNKRRLGMLIDKQTVSCYNSKCDESFAYVSSDLSFERRTFPIVCEKCNQHHRLPKKKIEKLRTDQQLNFPCSGCGDKIFVGWKPMQAQLPLSE